MSKILKLNSYSQYDELGDRDYMVYEVVYDDGHKDYVSRDIFRKLKALETIKRSPVMVICEFYKCAIELKMSYEEYCDYFSEDEQSIKTREEYDSLKEALL